jgi:hypothetical protein
MKKDIRAELGLSPGQSIELLQELHIVTRDGRSNQDSRRKLKQVHHLYQFIEKLLLELPAEGGHPTLADHGAGKSYLGFVLYDLFFQPRGVGHIYGIETRAELVEKSRELARRLGFERMSFLHLSAADAGGRRAVAGEDRPGDRAACMRHGDGRRDRLRLKKQAPFMVLVPCCQAEGGQSLAENKALPFLEPRFPSCGAIPAHARDRQPGHERAALSVPGGDGLPGSTVTELVGWEHSMKNELILARRTGQRKRSAGGAAACDPGGVSASRSWSRSGFPRLARIRSSKFQRRGGVA